MTRAATPRQVLGLAFALAVVTFAVYWPTHAYEFTNFDDPDYITDNPAVMSGLTPAGLRWAFTSTSAAMWHPITWVAHMIVWQTFGANSGGHHLVNVSLHALNVALFFLLLRGASGATWRSAAAAALFGWHPLRVESVAWAAELKDVLAMTFWLLTCLAYVAWLRTRTWSGRVRLWILYALGLMTKPMLVTLPFALVLLDGWPLRRIRWPFGATEEKTSDGTAENSVETSTAWPKVSLWVSIREKLPLFGLGMLFSLLTVLTSRGGTNFAQVPIPDRVANAFVSYGRYLSKTFYPIDLAVLYPLVRGWPWTQVLASVFLVGAITGFVIWQARRRPQYFGGWFWFVGTLVPVIGFVQAGPQAMADRFTYVPGLGLTVAVVWGVAELGERLFGQRSAGYVGGCAAIALAMACLWITRIQLATWQNSITLFTRAVTVTDRNVIANYNLGQALSVAGRVAEAVRYYEAAIRIDPQYDPAYNNLGLAYAVLGSPEKSPPLYQKAIEIKPENYDAHYNLALVDFTAGRVDAAATHLENVIRLSPQHAWAHYWLGRVRKAQGKSGDALVQYSTALDLNPACAEANYELALLAIDRGDRSAALAYLQAALQSRNNYPEARARFDALEKGLNPLPQ